MYRIDDTIRWAMDLIMYIDERAVIEAVVTNVVDVTILCGILIREKYIY